MSEPISKRIKELERQNQKFRQLLNATLEVSKADSERCYELQAEAQKLKKVLNELHGKNQSMQLGDVQEQLMKVYRGIEGVEVDQLITNDDRLKQLIEQLEAEKLVLLKSLEMVQNANEEQRKLSEHSLVLTEQLVSLENEKRLKQFDKLSFEESMTKLQEIDSSKKKLEREIDTFKNSTTNLLGIPVENTVLELNVFKLQKQEAQVLNTLRANLLKSTKEVSELCEKASSNQLQEILSELDITKTTLILNIKDIKQMIVEEQKHAEEYQECDLLPTVAEEEETQNNELMMEQKELEVNKLEHFELMPQNEYGTMDDATNQLLKIGEDLHGILDEDDDAVLLQGEQLIRDFKQ